MKEFSVYAVWAFLLLLLLIPESIFLESMARLGVFPAWIGISLLFLTSPYVIFLLAALGWFAFRKARGQSLY